MVCFSDSKGLIDNQFDHYIRDDGLTNYRANEVAQQARMLTILALYHSYSGDDATLLRHFAKAKALADWLRARRETSLAEFTPDDPRYGLIAGLDEGDSFVHVYFHQGPYPVQCKGSSLHLRPPPSPAAWLTCGHRPRPALPPPHR